MCGRHPSLHMSVSDFILRFRVRDVRYITLEERRVSIIPSMPFSLWIGGRHGRESAIFGSTTTYAISADHK